MKYRTNNKIVKASKQLLLALIDHYGVLKLSEKE